MKVHKNCKGEECGSNYICSKKNVMRYGCVNHEPDIELCVTCKHFVKYDDGSSSCTYHLDEADPNDYCPCWQYGGD